MSATEDYRGFLNVPLRSPPLIVPVLGINCRFGMKGVISTAHYDSRRNFIAMIRGRKRYYLILLFFLFCVSCSFCFTDIFFFHLLNVASWNYTLVAIQVQGILRFCGQTTHRFETAISLLQCLYQYTFRLLHDRSCTIL
jgi:hypothetical protein